MTDHQIADAMIVYGGSFVQAFGRALVVADAHNLARLRAAFPELFAQYAEVVQLRAARVKNEGRE